MNECTCGRQYDKSNYYLIVPIASEDIITDFNSRRTIGMPINLAISARPNYSFLVRVIKSLEVRPTSRYIGLDNSGKVL